MQGIEIVGSNGQDGAVKLRGRIELAGAMERHGPANGLAFAEARWGCRGRLAHARKFRALPLTPQRAGRTACAWAFYQPPRRRGEQKREKERPRARGRASFAGGA